MVHSEKTPEAVIAAIKAGCSEVVTNPLPLKTFAGTIGAMKSDSLKKWITRVVAGR